MKCIRAFVFLAAMVAGTSAFSQQTISAGEVQVTISGSTSRMELAQLRTDLEQVGVRFWYEPQFDTERNLIAIRYDLADLAGNAALGSAEAADLQNPAVRTSFRLSKNGAAWTAQCVGSCD
jgi:hypothetical protein